ncbi:MAG: TIGR01777 family oxidoreductase [Terracidiphilus sp.]
MNHSSPKILLSGASGIVGSALRQALAERGTSVLQLVRRPTGAPLQVEWNPNASHPVADLEPLENLTAAIHLSGANLAAHRWTSAYKREIVESRVRSTRALVKALAGLRNPPQAIFVASATGIYGNRADQLLDESSTPGSGFIADLCQQWEAAAHDKAAAGIRIVHLRFGVALGPGVGALARMLPIFRLSLGGPLGPGTQWMSWISLHDVVAAILFLLESPSLNGPVNLTAPNPVTNSQFTSALARAVHRPAFLSAPGFALRLALGEIADEVLLASARVYPGKLITDGFRFTYPKIDQALAAALGLPQPVSPSFS